MPHSWTKGEIRRAVDALKSGTALDDVAAWYPVTRDAFLLAMSREGYSVRALCREGQVSRVRKILAAGGTVTEVMVGERVKFVRAYELIREATGVPDRRTLRRTTTVQDDRRIFLAAREHGFKEAARVLGMALTSVRRAALRYQSEVLPNSPPLTHGRPHNAQQQTSGDDAGTGQGGGEVPGVQRPTRRGDGLVLRDTHR